MGQLEQIQQDIQRIMQIQDSILEKLNTEKAEPEIVNIDGLIQYRPFLKSKQKVYAMVRRRAIPYHKQGKNLLFKLSEVDDYLTKNKLKAV